MRPILLSLLAAVSFANAANDPEHGPGRGIWEFDTPENQGLNYDELYVQI